MNRVGPIDKKALQDREEAWGSGGWQVFLLFSFHFLPLKQPRQGEMMRAVSSSSLPLLAANDMPYPCGAGDIVYSGRGVNRL